MMSWRYRYCKHFANDDPEVAAARGCFQPITFLGGSPPKDGIGLDAATYVVMHDELYWWKPTSETKGYLELVVRAYKNESGQVFIGTLLHTKGDDIAVKLEPPKKQ